MKLVIGVLISGGGSNLQAIIDGIRDNYIPETRIAAVASNNKDAYGLKRAEQSGIETIFVNPKEYGDEFAYNEKLADEFISRDVNLVCLAGYLLMVKGKLLERYKGRILNIHPALLPEYGGKGMYGHFVHEAVLKAGEKKSGASVHLVDDKYDHGRVLLQKEIEVLPDDTAGSLAQRVLTVEHKLYPEVLKLIAGDKIKMEE